MFGEPAHRACVNINATVAQPMKLEGVQVILVVRESKRAFATGSFVNSFSLPPGTALAPEFISATFFFCRVADTSKEPFKPTPGTER